MNNKASDVTCHSTCYVALGSNLGDSPNYLDKAVLALNKLSAINNLTVSQYYLSKPHGPQDQPDYCNAAVKFETSLKAENLLDELQKIEDENERVRKGVIRGGARTLDLDLLFYANEIIDTPRLTVPHPRICERPFVLLPLRDLGASLKDLGGTSANGTSIEECIRLLPASALKNIKEYND